jgi:hypothetical protein
MCCIFFNLSVVQTENVVEDVVRTILGDQVEGLGEHLRVGFIIDLCIRILITAVLRQGKIPQRMQKKITYQKLTSNEHEDVAARRISRLSIKGGNSVLDLLERKAL